MATRRTASTPTPKADQGSAAPKAPRRARRAKPKANSAATAVSEDERRAMIAEAAYFHAERRGFAPGDTVQDWLNAEAEIDALLRAAHLGRPQ